MSYAWNQDRLDTMRTAMARHAEGGRMPGLVTLINRYGETHVEAYGVTAFGGDRPMRPDTIFRIASITKPILAAAAMSLVEETRLRLDDPVDAWLPELADRQVLRSLESEVDDTVPAERAITLRDLLTFRAGYGLVMVYPQRHPIQFAMAEAGVAPGPVMPSFDSDELLRRYGSLPLLHQPGAGWAYNSGADILGVLLSRVEGKALGSVLHERIFDPLGMKDTGFFVPDGELDRLPSSYTTNWQTGGIDVFDPDGPSSNVASQPRFESGAGGLVSTAGDLLAFGEMMLGRGTHGSARILSRTAIEVMTTDQIAPAQKSVSDFYPGFWDRYGWGLGLSVITNRIGLAPSVGSFGWDGGFGTSFWVDPTEGLIGVLLTQRVWDSPVPPPVLVDFWASTYAAIGD